MAAKRDPQTEKSAGSAPVNLSPSELAETGKNHVAAMVEVKRRFFEAAQEWNRDYFASASAETMLACEIAVKLMTAQSIPETSVAYRDWLERWVGRFGKDSQRLFADGQKFVEASSRFVSDGWTAR